MRVMVTLKNGCKEMITILFISNSVRNGYHNNRSWNLGMFEHGHSLFSVQISWSNSTGITVTENKGGHCQKEAETRGRL